MNYARSRNRFVTALVCLLLSSIAFGQASPVADKPAPKVSYLLAGRLSAATNANVHETVVSAVEDERI